MEIRLATSQSRSEVRFLDPNQSRITAKQNQDDLNQSQDGLRQQAIKTRKPNALQKKQSNTQNVANQGSKGVRLFGFFLILAIIGMMFSYGYASQINIGSINFTYAEQNLIGAGTFCQVVFIILGFGLVLAYHNETIFSSFFITIYTISFTVLASPLLQKFWFNVFIAGFSGAVQDGNIQNTVLFQNQSGSPMMINYSTIKTSLLCAISQLVLYLGFIGRAPIYRVIVISFVFVTIWNLNYFLCICLVPKSVDNRFMDDYAISMVYTFGGVIGLILALDVKSFIVKKRSPEKQPIFAQMLGLIGTFFVFFSFSFTYSITGYQNPNATDANRAIFYPEGCIGVFFAMSASVMSSYAFSILISKPNKIGLSTALLSSISGGILFGPYAAYPVNIGIPLAVGVMAGAKSALYSRYYLPLINARRVYDSMGVFGTLLLSSLLGTFVVSPIVVASHASYKLTPPALGTTYVVSSLEAPWLLAYVGITVAISALTGAVLSLIFRCTELAEKKIGDDLLFMDKFRKVETVLDNDMFPQLSQTPIVELPPPSQSEQKNKSHIVRSSIRQ